jgi:hypothetical protein
MPAALGIIGVLLVAIVGVASAGSPLRDGSAGGSGSTMPALVVDVLGVVLAVALCAFVVLSWVATSQRAKRKRRRRRGTFAADEVAAGLRGGSRSLVTGLVLVLLIVAFALVLGRPATSTQPPVRPVGRTAAPVPPTTQSRADAGQAVHWFVIALAATAAVMVPLGLLARRRQLEPEPSSSDPQDLVARAVVDSIGEIERDPDARRSIIRAYARMEAAFGETGMPRRPHEAPFEFVGRALGGVRVSPPSAERLATLFERARFSRHPIGAKDKGEALGALREVQRELEPEP